MERFQSLETMKSSNSEFAEPAIELRRVTKVCGLAIERCMALPDSNALVCAEFLEDLGNTYLDYAEQFIECSRNQRAARREKTLRNPTS